MPDAMEDDVKRPLSRFVRDRIRSLPFNNANRKYVHRLLVIEELALRPPSSMAGGMLDESLRVKHPREYRAIYNELNHAEHHRRLRQVGRWTHRLHAEERREATHARRERQRDRELCLRVAEDGERAA